MSDHTATGAGEPPRGQPGWHPDPWGQHALRWWDGSQWTDQVHDDATPMAAQNAAPGALSPDTGMAQAAHLLTIVTSFIGPLIIWVTRGKEDAFVEQHAKEALNFQISMAIYYTVALLLMFVLVGFLLFPLLVLVDIVLVVMETLKAGRGEASRYPLSIRIIT